MGVVSSEHLLFFLTHQPKGVVNGFPYSPILSHGLVIKNNAQFFKYRTISALGSRRNLAVYTIRLGGHHEIVAMQIPDLMCPPGNFDLPPLGD